MSEETRHSYDIGETKVSAEDKWMQLLFIFHNHRSKTNTKKLLTNLVIFM